MIVRSDLETIGDGNEVAVQHYDQFGRVRLSRSIENIATEDPYNETHGIKVETRYQTGNPNRYRFPALQAGDGKDRLNISAGLAYYPKDFLTSEKL